MLIALKDFYLNRKHYLLILTKQSQFLSYDKYF